MKDWAKLLSTALANEPDKVPKGWETSQQIASRPKWPWSLSRTRALLAQLVKSGEVEAHNYRIRTGQRILPVPHYRITAHSLK